MSGPNISRRKFTAAASFGLIATCTQSSLATQDVTAEPHYQIGPREADFKRDYDAPSFKPNWKKAQVNRTMAQDFVIYAHSDLPMVKKLLAREPGLLNATLDWGGGDWETALGGASHMGRRDIVEYLLEQGGRPDIFCFTMLGMLEPVQSILKLQPSLIDAKGPHGFNLHFHAQVGQENSKEVLDYLQSVKEVELRPVPFLRKK